MRTLLTLLRRQRAGFVLALTIGAVDTSASEVVQSVFRANTAFPQYMPLWWDGWPWQNEKGNCHDEG